MYFSIIVKRDSSILITNDDGISTFKYCAEVFDNDNIILVCDSSSFVFYPNNEVKHVLDEDCYLLYKNPM